jgi:DNA repair protein RadC
MRYQRAAQPLKLDGLEAARAFFAGCFAESAPVRECLWVAHVDDRLQCIHVSRYEGDAGGAELPVRSIVADAALLGSTGILLAHNHPSGDPRPSTTDCTATRRLSAAVESIGSKILDHLMFGGGRFASFREMGLL